MRASVTFYGLLVGLSLLICACAPSPSGAADGQRQPLLHDSHFVTADNTRLPVRVWNSKTIPPKAVIVGLHGFNDYSKAYDDLAAYLAKEHRIYTYAYDQRGFGDAGERGTWAGTETYVRDLRAFCDSVRERFPDVPLYVMGESMGGAVAMVAFTSDDPPDADGVILSAPAVWARRTMPWYQRFALFVAAHTVPWASFTGEGVVDITVSDNKALLRELGRDPKIVKDTKVASMYGLTNLMDAALNSADEFNEKALVMVGEKDEIVPNPASAEMLASFQEQGRLESERLQVAIYDQGYHMLFRDLHREIVWQDVAAWIQQPGNDLPSQADDKDIDQWIKTNSR